MNPNGEETTGLINKALRRKLLVIEALVFVVPFSVSWYLYQRANPVLEISHTLLLTFILILVLAGFVILRQVFDRFLILTHSMAKVTGSMPQREGLDAESDSVHDLTAVLERLSGKLEQTGQDLERNALELLALKELTKIASKTLDLNKLLDALLEKAMAVSGAATGSIFLVEADGEWLRVAASAGRDPRPEEGAHISLERSSVREVVSQRKALLLQDDALHAGSESPHGRSSPSAPHLSLPIMVRHEVVGILNLSNWEEKGLSYPDSEQVLTTMIGEVAFALENARLHAKVQETLKNLEIESEQNANANRELERQIMEKEESEERFRIAFHTSPDSININRLEDGLYVDINEGFTALTGYTREDVIGRRSTDVNIWHDPKDRDKLVDILNRHGEVNNLEALFRLKDGRVRTGLMSAKIITLKNVPHTLSVTRDIEDLKEAERALRESQEKYRLLVETANDAIFIAQGGVVKFPNPRTEAMVGYSAEELERIPFTDLIHPEDRDLVWERHSRRLKGETPPNTYQFRIMRKNGEVLWVELNTIFLSWEGAPATLNILRDVTQHKKLEARFLQAQKMEAIGTLAGGIAHDFNNLLMGIQGNTSLMLTDTDTDHPHHPMLRSIEKCVKSAAELTSQLLGFARGGKYEVRPTDPNRMVLKTAEMFARTRKEITVHSDLEEHVWTVEVDRGQIDQVLLNLYVNAWQAMPDGGDLYLITRNVMLGEEEVRPHQLPAGKYVRISVQDTGIGLDDDIKERIFEPFFTTRDMGKGSGLGLASVYGIVKNHGGMVSVESEKGRGTRFDIFLPASEKTPAVETEPLERPEKATGMVLLVDDEDMVLNVGTKMMESLGCRILTAKSGREALEIYRTSRDEIDAVVLDFIMPGMGGGETYDRLREINAHVKVLLSSGYSMNGKVEEIMERGCRGFIQKPFDMATLSKKLREILKG